MDRFYQGNLKYGFRHLALLYKRSHDDTVSFYNSNYAVLIVLTAFFRVLFSSPCVLVAWRVLEVLLTSSAVMGV